ncbi:MAG: methylmalonyl-CoA mutase [Dehalococcoidia bacterium]|nr:methylmalonyl-CoA mutase [Dehalococcoidia bacterium]
MYNAPEVDAIKKRLTRWNENGAKAPERRGRFENTSGIEVERLYTPADVEHQDYGRDIGLPGEYPFTRGIHPTGYRTRVWTMRMFAGFGSAEETNERYKFLLSHGETGLSCAFDLPTLMGVDADDPMAFGEFGKGGVCVSSLSDMELLFRDIPIEAITTSMTINGPAANIWAMFLANAQNRGVPIASIGGTLQNDILKEYIAQNEYLYPPRDGVRLVVDTIEYAMKHMPKWNPVSISGYHIREAGATAAQELAFTLADGLTYVEESIKRGMSVDEFGPRLSFFFNIHNDFFEEIAKLRAARRMWARFMKERFGATNQRAMWMRFHSQTAGATLTAKQPENNVTRVAIQALAAVMGGTQSLHTNSLDEVLALPSETAARIALRTQQIIAHETGITDTVDPLGGSYYIERLTDDIEAAAMAYIDKIDGMGGVVAGIENGYFVREIADAARRYQDEIDRKERIVVGVNDHLDEGTPLPIPILKMDPQGEPTHMERLARIKRERDGSKVERSMDALRDAARSDQNLMPLLLDAVHAHATLGEVSVTLRDAFGGYLGIQM